MVNGKLIVPAFPAHVNRAGPSFAMVAPYDPEV